MVFTNDPFLSNKQGITRVLSIIKSAQSFQRAAFQIYGFSRDEIVLQKYCPAQRLNRTLYRKWFSKSNFFHAQLRHNRNAQNKIWTQAESFPLVYFRL